MIAALSVALSLTVLPAGAVDDPQPLHVPAGEQFVYAYKITETGRTLYFYFTGNDEMFVGNVDGSVYCATPNYTQYQWGVNGSQVDVASTNLGNNFADVTIWHSKLYFYDGYSAISSIPVFDSEESFYYAVANYEPESAAAILVPPGGTYTWQTGRTIQNDSDVNIAVGAWYDGFDYGTCVASYENLVLPGTRNGVAMNYSLSNSDSITGLFYNAIYISEGEPDPGVPVFQPLDTFLTSAAEVLGSYSPTVNSVNLGFYLEPGNVAYLNLTDLSAEITLTAEFDRYNSLLPAYGSYFAGNQFWRSGASYPSPGVDIDFPVSGSVNIPWQKNPNGATNLVGSTKSAIAVLHPDANLVEIYNPYNMGDDTGASYETNVLNPSIYINAPGVARNGIRVYELKDTFDPNTFWGISSTSPSQYNDYSDTINNPNDPNDPGITGWRDQDGDDTETPGPSQYNEPPENLGITDILKGFLSNISDLFTQGHDAIRSLSSGATEFVQHLGSLYTWLPAPVYSVLTSAIVLAIIIGVLKVFL